MTRNLFTAAILCCAIISNAQTKESATDTVYYKTVLEAIENSIGDFNLNYLGKNCISTKYEAGGIAGSGDYAPFWHISNRQGLFGTSNEQTYVRIGAKGMHRFSGSSIRVDWGVDIVDRFSSKNSLYLQEAYADFTWKRMTLSLGQKERWGEMKNPRLSTGALVESGNARPIPQIRIELPEYWNIPGTKGWAGIRGHLAYGWFTDENWQEDFAAPGKARTVGVRYHSKAGFMRIGNIYKFPLTAEIGLHMATQFGGTVYNRGNIPGNKFHNPARPKDYWTAFLPTKGDASYSAADQANVAGNMLGSWMGALTWCDKEWTLRAYYEHVFEDHSQMFWEYGLWTEQLVGLELQLPRFKWIKCVVLEYFNLKNQSGPIYHDTNSLIPDQISCVDNNYWHHTYNSWANYGMMIGTALVTSPVYNTDGTLGVYNSRVEAFNLGIEGSPMECLDYRLLLTKSNNWGTYDNPFKEIKSNTSGLVELTYHPAFMENWSLTASFAFDSGKLYGDNYAGMITIVRRNIFKF